MNINQSNLNHNTLQSNLFDIASDVKSLEIRKKDDYVFKCLSNNMVKEIINHGAYYRRREGGYLSSSYVLYQLPNCDFAYVFITYGKYRICINEENFFKVIKYISYDNPNQLSDVLNTISDRISHEYYLKKESMAIQKLVTANKNLTRQLSTLKASYNIKQMITVKNENTMLERAVKNLLEQNDELDQVIDELIRSQYSITFTFKKRISNFVNAFINLFK